MAPECNVFESPAALKIAKNNVEKYYAVVGILERWDESLQVFEHYVPAFFKDALKVYRKMKKEKVNVTKIKPQIPKYIKDKVAANFTMELEFYEFCRQRFQKQFLTIS